MYRPVEIGVGERKEAEKGLWVLWSRKAVEIFSRFLRSLLGLKQTPPIRYDWPLINLKLLYAVNLDLDHENPDNLINKVTLRPIENYDQAHQ